MNVFSDNKATKKLGLLKKKSKFYYEAVEPLPIKRSNSIPSNQQGIKKKQVVYL